MSGLVLGAGVEPARSCDQRILSPSCIPIPPPEQLFVKLFYFLTNEATARIALAYIPFAEECLTTWLRGRIKTILAFIY